MGLPVFTVLFTRLAGVFLILFYLAMVYATVTPEDPVTIKIPSSGGSSTAGNKWNCMATASPTHSVRFHSVTINGTVYDKTLINQTSLTSDGQIVQKNFKATDLGACLLAAGRAGVDAISYINSVCSGYIIKTTLHLCPCSSDVDTLVFMRKNKITPGGPIYNGSFASGAYIKTVVYSDVLANESARLPVFNTAAYCEANIGADGLMSSIGQFVIKSGSCYKSGSLYNVKSCTSCTGTPVTVYTSAQQSQNIPNFMDSCGATITLSVKHKYYAYSHAAYGCYYYPQPTTATNCEVTIAKGAGVTSYAFYVVARLSSSGSTCNDELVVYQGTSSSGVVVNRTCTGTGTVLYDGSVQDKLTFVFKRNSPVTGASEAFGFQLTLFYS